MLTYFIIAYFSLSVNGKAVIILTYGGYGVTVNTAGCGPADESSTLSSHPMGILETLILIFFGLFLVGLILSVTIWLVWLFLILTVVLSIVKLVRGIVKRFFSKKTPRV